MSPFTYGYLRITKDLADDEPHPLENGLEKLVDVEGFRLTETCYEYQPGYYGHALPTGGCAEARTGAPPGRAAA